MALQRISLTDTSRRERLVFQFAPESLIERISPKYKKILPINGSRQTSYYLGTESEVVPLELFFTLIGAPDGQGATQAFPNLQQIETLPIANPDDFAEGGDPEIRPSIEGPARFLKSLCYNDPEIADGISGAVATPLVVLDWPGILALEGHIEELEIGYRQFDTRDMRGLVLVANFDFVEDFEFEEAGDKVNERIRNSRVRVMGSNRANRKLIPRAQRRRGARQPQTVVFTRELT